MFVQRKTRPKFQFSIGDARPPRPLLHRLRRRLFQFSIGDTSARASLSACLGRCGFNSLLEMRGRRCASYARVPTRHRFQFSIGDAPLFHLSSSCVQEVSILYWRCPLRKCCRGGSTIQMVSILYWRCGRKNHSMQLPSQLL